MIKRKVGSQIAIWPPSTKSQESTWFRHMQGECNISLESLDEGYSFALDLIVIRGLHMKLCASKIVGVLVVGISGLPFGSLKTKSHLDVAPVESYRVYYKGEGGGFPQVQAVVSLVCLSCPWFILTPKVFQLCTNHPVLVLCRFVWIIEACQFFLVPSPSSSTPFYPSRVLWARERAPNSLLFRCF
jgi:hypothetical protein